MNCLFTLIAFVIKVHLKRGREGREGREGEGWGGMVRLKWGGVFTGLGGGKDCEINSWVERC